MPDSELDQAIEAIQAGQKAQGLTILARLVNQEPRNERAWLWLATCVDEPEKKRYCLQRVLEINPASAAGRQLLAELDAPAPPPPAPAENNLESEVAGLRSNISERVGSSVPAQGAETLLPAEETPKPFRLGEWGVILMTGLHAGLIGLILAVPLQFFGLLASADTTKLWAAYSVLWIGVGLIAGYLLRLRGLSNKVSRAVVGAPAGCVTGMALSLVTAFTLSVIFKPNDFVLDSSDSVILNFITSTFLYGGPLAFIGMALGVLGALIMIGVIGMIDWVREPEGPTKDEGPKAKDQGPRAKDKGPRHKAQGSRAKEQGPRTKSQ